LSKPVPRSLIAEAVDLIIFIEKYGRSRRIKTIARVKGMKDDEYVLELLP
jgi:Flp pilus assembly CpaF family ATPase